MSANRHRPRLDDHEGSVRLQHLANVPRGADWIAHVVQAVEAADKVVVAARRTSFAEDTSNRDVCQIAGLLGASRGALDRLVVIVEAEEGAVRKGLGHDDRRGAVSAADVRDLRSRLSLSRTPSSAGIQPATRFAR